MITIPTLATLISDVKSDLETQYGDSIPIFGKVFLYALILGQAGKLKVMYLILAKLQKNIFVDTADPEASGGTLERWGRIKLGRNPFGASIGEYTLTVTSSIIPFAAFTIPAETLWRAQGSNLLKKFIIDEDVEITSASQNISIRALEGGEGSRLIVGRIMKLMQPVESLDTESVILTEDVIPQSEEDIEVYRAAVLEAFRLEPQGGAASDYRLWSDDVSGVAQVYPYAKQAQSADVIVYVEALLADSSDGLGSAPNQMLTDIRAVFEQDPDTSLAIDERGRRPLGVFILEVLSTTPKAVEVEIPSSDFTAAEQLVIQTAMEERMATIRPFIAAADILALKDNVLDLNILTSVILTAYAGRTFGTIIMTIDTQVSTYTFSAGEFPYLSTITFTP